MYFNPAKLKHYKCEREMFPGMKTINKNIGKKKFPQVYQHNDPCNPCMLCKCSKKLNGNMALTWLNSQIYIYSTL